MGAVNPLAKMVARPIVSKPRADELLAGFANVPAVIPNHQINGEVGGLIKAIRAHVFTTEAERKQFLAPFKEGVERLNARYKLVTVPLKEAMGILNERTGAFLKEEERKAAELEARLREKQEAEAIEEAAALELRAAEEKKKADEERERAEALTQEGKAEEAAQARAQAEETDKQAAATTDHAQDIVKEAEVGVAPVILHQQTSRSSTGVGTALRDNWVATVTDITKLPAEFLLPNKSALNTAVRGERKLRKIPGCQIENKKTAVSR